MVDCPRCLGKGHVDVQDIMRLKKELFWLPGKCAYCNGIGKVPPDRVEKISVDFEYLTNDLPSWERHKVINGDSDALKRASMSKAVTQKIVGLIIQQYFTENQEPKQIADHIFDNYSRLVNSPDQKQSLIEYIETVINLKKSGG